MSTEIEAKEVTVGKLFSPDFVFKIPIYQRPLSWEKDNFDQLFEDILDAINSEQKQYFLGSIILQEHEHDENRFDLVDGQQRINSLAILMAVIRDYTDISDLKYGPAWFLCIDSMQGHNLKNKIYIDITNISRNNYIYTSITRCSKISNLIFVK